MAYVRYLASNRVAGERSRTLWRHWRWRLSVVASLTIMQEPPLKIFVNVGGVLRQNLRALLAHAEDLNTTIRAPTGASQCLKERLEVTSLVIAKALVDFDVVNLNVCEEPIRINSFRI